MGFAVAYKAGLGQDDLLDPVHPIGFLCAADGAGLYHLAVFARGGRTDLFHHLVARCGADIGLGLFAADRAFVQRVAGACAGRLHNRIHIAVSRCRQRFGKALAADAAGCAAQSAFGAGGFLCCYKAVFI